MQGLVYTKMGTPYVLKKEEVKKPIPSDSQILVRVKASSINASDYMQFESAVKTGKVATLFRIKEKLKDKKLGKVLGMEVSGVVEAIGKNVTNFNIGDEVFGVTVGLLGGWAEYACAEEYALCKKPANLSFEKAATMPIAGTTALAAIRKANVQKGQSVLVYGASGGVGQYTVQLLKAYGANVTAVCSTRNIEMAKTLGADCVIDYLKEDFSENGIHYDVILGVNGYNPISKYKNSLNETGTYVAIGGALQGMMGGVCGPFMSLVGKKKFTFSTFFTEIKKDSLSELKRLVENEKLKAIVDKTVSLEKVPETIEDLILNHAKGKIAIIIDELQ